MTRFAWSPRRSPALRPATHADRGADHGRHQTGERDGAGADDQLVPAHEPAGAVERARRARHHRLVREMAPDVVGELRRRAVAALAVLLDRLEHDPVEVAAQSARERGRVGRARAGDRGRRAGRAWRSGPRGAAPRARGSGGAARRERRCDRLLGQRAHAGEQLVEHHAERVDVGARVDVAAASACSGVM